MFVFFVIKQITTLLILLQLLVQTPAYFALYLIVFNASALLSVVFVMKLMDILEIQMISNACFAPFLIALSVAMILVVSYVIIRLTIFLTLMPILLIFVFFVILFIATCAQICKNALSVKNLITISSILQGRLQLINVLNVTFLNASCARV